MAEQELDALVVRAPDNVLYLTNFWGMKGYDACVFPREGEPVLLCLEASAEDAARTAWTDDVRYVRGYDETDPRPPLARTLDAARGGVARLRPRRPRALARHAGLRPDGRRADDVHEGAGSTRGRTRSTRRRCSPRRARSRPTRSSSGSGSRTRSAPRRWSTCAAELRPGMKESEAAALWQGFVHGEGTGWRGQGRARARLLARLVGRRASRRSPRPATGRCSEDEPTLFEIWVCADGYWCDHTKLLCPGELRADYRELEAALLEVYGRAIDHCRPGASLAELDRLIRDGHRRGRLSRASRRTRSATASAPAPTSRRTRTRPAAARSRSGWCSRSSRAATGRAAAACASRTTS